MLNRSRVHVAAESHGIDLAPMLDFVVNLLIFFIITAVFIKQAGIEVNRPSRVSIDEKSTSKSFVIDARGEISVDLKAVDLAANRVPADEKTYTKLANSWIEAGELDNAVAALERAGPLATTGATLVRLGEAQLDRGEWTKAEAVLVQAIAKGGLEDLGYAQYLIGIALFNEERFAESRSWFEQSRATPIYRESSERYLQFIAAERQPRRSM